MMSLAVALLVAFVQEPEVEPAEELEPTRVEHITAVLPDYPWASTKTTIGSGFSIYAHAHGRPGDDWLGWGFESEWDGERWSASRPAGAFAWLMWGNRSSWVSSESIVDACRALSHVEDLGLDFTNRHSTPEEIQAIAHAHPRLRGLMLREAIWSTWAMTPESLEPLAPSLHRLSINVARDVDDVYLSRLIAPLEELRHVRLDSAFGPRTAEVLATLEHLRSVELRGGSASVENIAKLLESGRIEEFRMYGESKGWPRSGWSELLGKASSLRGLGLALPSLDPDFVKRIIELPNLEWLEIYGTFGSGFDRSLARARIVRTICERPWKGLALPPVSKLDPDVARSLAAMPELEWLDLRGVERIDGDTLRWLEASKSLRLLDLPASFTDSSATQRLITANPKLRVHGGGYHWGERLQPR